MTSTEMKEQIPLLTPRCPVHRANRWEKTQPCRQIAMFPPSLHPLTDSPRQSPKTLYNNPLCPPFISHDFGSPGTNKERIHKDKPKIKKKKTHEPGLERYSVFSIPGREERKRRGASVSLIKLSLLLFLKHKSYCEEFFNVPFLLYVRFHCAGFRPSLATPIRQDNGRSICERPALRTKACVVSGGGREKAQVIEG